MLRKETRFQVIILTYYRRDHKLALAKYHCTTALQHKRDKEQRETERETKREAEQFAK